MPMDLSSKPPQSLKELLTEVLAECPTAEGRTDMLLTLAKKHHFWPAIQVKKFFSNPNLVLLHNTYKRTDVDHFQELYNECRSVVLDISAPLDSTIVATLSQGIPDRMIDRQYESLMKENDVCEHSYEGTMIFVYEYNQKWYFGTSGCPTIDASRYHHPTKTHGVMMDECLQELFTDDVIVKNENETERDYFMRRGQILRNRFTGLLDVSKTYTFLMVHHENRHIMDYTEEFGDNYKVFFHLNTKDRKDFLMENFERVPELEEKGVKYVRVYDSPEHALMCLRDNNPYPSYGFIVKRQNASGIIRVSMPHIVEREETDLGNHNKWQNMLWSFLQNKDQFTVEDYVKKYASDIVLPTDSLGRLVEAPYLVTTVVESIVQILYTLYRSTTHYTIKTRRFKMNKEMDASLAPILRFHLGQLRHLQVTQHTHATITHEAVFDYVRHHQSLKNIRLLIRFFASYKGPEMSFRQTECFSLLDKMLSN